jgi:hypothetical protein
MPETELAERQQVVDSKVNAALNAIFGIEYLDGFPSIRQLLLRIGLASHLIHFDNYSNPVYRTDPRPVIPANSVLQQTPLYTNPCIQQLKQHVTIVMP